MNKKRNYTAPVAHNVATMLANTLMQTSRYQSSSDTEVKVKTDNGDEEPDPLAKRYSAWDTWDD